MSSPRVYWPAGVEGLLERCSFPGKGAPVVCAVSGGPDSVAMLALAVAAGCSAHAVHVDHGLRAGSREEAAVVEAAANTLGATFEALSVRVGPGPDLEARARQARYGVLPEGTMVGHTADDQAETLLLNLMRGAGLDGLRGMRATSGGLRKAQRPILALRRSETLAFVTALGFPTVTDPSNAEGRFRRNRARHEVLPLLADVAGRDLVPVLARTAALLAEDAELLDLLARDLDPTDARGLAAAPRPLANRALRTWLREDEGPERHPPSSEDLERAWAVVTGRAVACELSGGRRLSRSAGRLRLDGSQRR
ncbi:MAG TPA: tRNA lysidine(34) synthetase TilS [Acidimicrobiales bacterium]|nr:tRNA lysidine(34) synthetase TilS [Acidimicrobiales bacterium]